MLHEYLSRQAYPGKLIAERYHLYLDLHRRAVALFELEHFESLDLFQKGAGIALSVGGKNLPGFGDIRIVIGSQRELDHLTRRLQRARRHFGEMAHSFQRIACQDRANTRCLRLTQRRRWIVEVDVVDVAGRADGKNREHAGTFRRSQVLREGVRVVCRITETAGGIEVAGEIKIGGEGSPGGPFKQDHGEVGIDSSSGPNDVWIEPARVPADRAVFHVVTPDEADVVFAGQR